MTVSASFAYDDPNYTLIRQSIHSAATTTATATQPGLTFRSRVACVMTNISAILGGTVATTTLIITLLFNGSIAALLTLEESINEFVGTFTMAANRTLTALTDRFEIGVGAGASAPYITVVYEYRIVPGSTFSLAAALT
jgi:hypothetical protein